MGAKDLLTVGGLALLDSLNISLLLATLYLLVNNQRPIPRVLLFVGVFYAVYVVAGFALASGAAAIGGALGGSAGKLIQLAVGALLLLYGIFARTEPREQRAGRTGAVGYLATMGLALTVAAVEVATALPYLAAISVLSQSGLDPVVRLLIILGYNLIVVAPCLIAAIAYTRSRSRMKSRFEEFIAKRQEKKKKDRKGLLLLCIIAGFYIAGDALVKLEFFGLVELTEEQRRKIHSY
ncbi:GAP family protein [Amycolatopsis albispora]|uniref:GAP family protein n=1 Tax=Amycolatopsis albispora TaxID=1804986 RepID=A0A344L5H7_9PSEU|nr:GAP family protein [Amycolatopsis albispora]AXB43301.1 hypothetical protein A4R43_12670 [Amycolatopsis albispora]